MAKKLYDYDYATRDSRLPKKEYQTARGEKGFLDAKIYASNWHTPIRTKFLHG